MAVTGAEKNMRKAKTKVNPTVWMSLVARVIKEAVENLSIWAIDIADTLSLSIVLNLVDKEAEMMEAQKAVKPWQAIAPVA